MTVPFSDLFSQAADFLSSGQLDEAEKAYADIQALAAEERDLGSLIEAKRLGALCLLYRQYGQSRQAYRDGLEALAQALKLAIEAKDIIVQAKIYRDMAVACDRANDLNNAATFYQKSIALISPEESAPELGLTYAELSGHLSRTNQAEGALKMNDKAIELIRRDGTHSFYLALALYKRAVILFQLGQMEEAASTLEESLGWFEADHGSRRYDLYLCRLWRLAALIHDQLPENRRFSEAPKRFGRLLRSLDPTTAQAIEMELRYLTD